ncbi:MAG: helix-turn-helix transcriptional regulator [Methanobrevibacter sp.]|nr:helix-turn-helix transcriptional regulator [Methanobrevibacter sp.]
MTKGQRIKQRREELNIGQTELAQKVHISKQTLYKYENDIVSNIPSNRLEEIAAALDTTPDFLMGWQDVQIIHDDNVIILPYKGGNEKAKELYEMYAKATPEIQSAVELLLKSAQQSPESPKMN